jgi:hypothetical protein
LTHSLEICVRVFLTGIRRKTWSMAECGCSKRGPNACEEQIKFW